MSQACYCCSGQVYAECCEAILQCEVIARSPEQLMRSRFSAFCSGAVNYLIDTLHPSARKLDDRVTIQETIDNTEWLGLKIVSSQAKGDEGVVEFAAFYVGGQLHEKSYFTKEGGLWFYVTGDILPPVKLSRNEDCFCGSGKKYKRCHGS